MGCCKLANNNVEEFKPVPVPQTNNTGFIILVLFILLAIIVGSLYSF